MKQAFCDCPNQRRLYRSFVYCTLLLTLTVRFVGGVHNIGGHYNAFVKPWLKGSKNFLGQGQESSSNVGEQSQTRGTKSMEEQGLGDGEQVHKILKQGIPPTLFFLFGTSESASASPLNPQAIVLKSPFFQGWLVRVTDHDKEGSFVLIIGSFSSKDSEEYDEHYIFCGIDSKKTSDNGKGTSECQLSCEIFPDPRSVTIAGDKTSTPLSRKLPLNYVPPTNITWRAAGLGQFTLNENRCSADLKFDNFKLRFNATHRLPWSTRNPDCGGPEGWLGYTNLLPCHYFVHSVGSPCTYSIDIEPQPLGADPDESPIPLPPPAPFFPLFPERDDQHQGHKFDSELPGFDAIAALHQGRGPRIGTRSWRHMQLLGDYSSTKTKSTTNDYSTLNDFLAPQMSKQESPDESAVSEITRQKSRILGRGLAHIEGNHGTFFPEGWVWAQAVAADNSASISLVTGKFAIGPMAPMNSVLYLRTHNRTRVFRSTDMDRIKVRCIDHSRGEVALTAVSIKDGTKVEVIIKDSPRSWVKHSPTIHIPTAHGFSNNPGCRETYSAVSSLKCYRRINARSDLVSLLSPEYELEEELEFPLTALEFGAGFLSRIIRDDGGWRLPWSSSET